MNGLNYNIAKNISHLNFQILQEAIQAALRTEISFSIIEMEKQSKLLLDTMANKLVDTHAEQVCLIVESSNDVPPEHESVEHMEQVDVTEDVKSNHDKEDPKDGSEEEIDVQSLMGIDLGGRCKNKELRVIHIKHERERSTRTMRGVEYTCEKISFLLNPNSSLQVIHYFDVVHGLKLFHLQDLRANIQQV